MVTEYHNLLIGNHLKRVKITKYKLNGSKNVSAVLIAKDYWIHFCPERNEDIIQRVIIMFNDMIELNSKQSKIEKLNHVFKIEKYKESQNYIVIEELDGNIMLGEVECNKSSTYF